jgi:PAS domain S-box-containing protein
VPDHDPDALLEESAEDFYEEAPCGYVSTRLDGTVVRVNRTLLDWTGHSREEVVGRKRFQDMLTAGGRIYHETHYSPLLQMQGGVREIAFEMLRADGSRLPVLVNSTVKTSADGSPELIRTTVFDATDRREYERELLRMRDRERSSRERAERLQRFTVRLSAALDVGEVERALLEELAESTDATEVALVDVAIASREPAFHERRDDAAGAVAVLPLVATPGARAAVCLRFGERHPFPEEERTFLITCAAQAGQALERARLYERERKVALTLQQSLLAGDPPSDPRFTVATHYSPAEKSLEVGGDWHDAFVVDEDRLAVVVGDVVGRGLGAASAMGQLRSAVRALAAAQLPPGSLLERLSAFVDQTDVGRVATVVYAEIDLSEGRLTYVCAGHPPPVLLQPEEAPRLLWDGRSPPLGIAVEKPRAEGQLTLRPGARLLLFSDGLVERRDRLLDDGLAQVMAQADVRRDSPPSRLVEELPPEVLAGAPSDDDVCLLCLSYEG